MFLQSIVTSDFYTRLVLTIVLSLSICFIGRQWQRRLLSPSKEKKIEKRFVYNPNVSIHNENRKRDLNVKEEPFKNSNNVNDNSQRKRNPKIKTRTLHQDDNVLKVVTTKGDDEKIKEEKNIESCDAMEVSDKDGPYQKKLDLTILNQTSKCRKQKLNKKNEDLKKYASTTRKIRNEKQSLLDNHNDDENTIRLDKTKDYHKKVDRERSNRKKENKTGFHPDPPPFHQISSSHPGLNKGFYQWQDAIASIYRVYRIGQQSSNNDANTNHDVFPIQPRSERGYVSVNLQVRNDTNSVIDVFWLDFKGREVPRGTIGPNGDIWYQTTWIGHPWIFRQHKEPKKLMVHFIPYRIIPNTNKVPTTSRNDKVGIHFFAIQDPNFISMAQNEICHIHDMVLPLPGDLSRVEKAIFWCCRQYEREAEAGCVGATAASIRTLLKYLKNIYAHPEESKYRQIRVANPNFYNQVWITAGRGILHALGFVEHGAYIEMGPSPSSTNELPRERLRHIEDTIFLLEQILQKYSEKKTSMSLSQPRGYDGSGRGGFGIAGDIN